MTNFELMGTFKVLKYHFRTKIGILFEIQQWIKKINLKVLVFQKHQAR